MHRSLLAEGAEQQFPSGARDHFNHQIDLEMGPVAPKAPYMRNIYGALVWRVDHPRQDVLLRELHGQAFVTRRDEHIRGADDGATPKDVHLTEELVARFHA